MAIEKKSILTNVEATPSSYTFGSVLATLESCVDVNKYFNPTGPQITSVSGPITKVNSQDIFFVVDLDSWDKRYRRGGVVTIGTVGSSRRGIFEIYNADKDNNRLTLIAPVDGTYNAPIVGDYVYNEHQYIVGVNLGFAHFTLGDGGLNGSVRAAIVWCPTNVASTLTTWSAAEQYAIWYRIYPAGASVTVDFAGLSVSSSGYLPLTSAIDDVVPRAHVIIYDVNTGSASTSNVVTQITYRIESTLDYNAV